MNPYGQISINTTKGLALMAAGVAAFRGERERVAWDQGGAGVDRDSLTIDGQEYELVELATDSTFDILTFWDNTDPEISQVLAAHALVVGQYVAVESEIAQVIYVNGTSDAVGFRRGMAGTAIVAHSTGTDPILVDDGTTLTVGAITVPTDVLTAELVIDRFAAIVSASNWSVVKLSASRALILSTVAGDRAAVLAENLTNGTITATTGAGGSSHAAMPTHCFYRAPTADEVSDGNIYIPLPFKPVHAEVTVFDDAAGAIKAWDGAVAYDQVANVVTIDNGGATDWAADDFVACVVHGEPQAPGTLVAG